MNEMWNSDPSPSDFSTFQDQSDPKPPTPGSHDGRSTGGSMDDITREVEAAMAAMSPHDLAELRGESKLDDLSPGAEVIGTISGVTDSDIFVQFGLKTQGVMPRNHFGKKEPLSIGRRVDCVVERFDAESGLLIVSRKGAVQRATWTNLTVGMIVEGRATGLIKGGLEIDLKGVRAFMPASQVDSAQLKDISIFLNQVLRCEVIELDRRSKSVIVSRRKVIERERAEQREKLKAELEPGQRRSGVVRSITDFGAFVDLGGVDGLIHLRDLSWGMVGKVTDVLSVGQAVEVIVLKIDKARDRISLGLKQALPDPWKEVGNKYPVGIRLKARVLRIADFGAFAELETGVEGLIPLSEMSWNRIRKPEEAVKVGDIVDVVIIRLEEDKRRIAMSMKQTQSDPWAGVFESYPVHSVVTGKVTRMADFGVFVELAPGVEGMIHISELADHRVKSCSEVVQIGQEVEAKVLGVDRENHRISLSIKALQTATAVAAFHEKGKTTSSSGKPPRKRKKPLRGGLASHFEW